jgi:hypothetical protein
LAPLPPLSPAKESVTNGTDVRLNTLIHTMAIIRLIMFDLLYMVFLLSIISKVDWSLVRGKGNNP